MMKRVLTLAAVAAGGVILANSLKQRKGADGLSTVQESVEVDVPVKTAYNQFTQFEQFPQFMSSVKEVRQLSDTKLRWRASIAGKEKEWEAEITRQVPDQCIAWRGVSGVANEGLVSFESIGENRTRITLEMSYMPESAAEDIGDAFGAVKLQLKENLAKFKQMLESRGGETGAWRGTVSPHH